MSSFLDIIAFTRLKVIKSVFAVLQDCLYETLFKTFSTRLKVIKSVSFLKVKFIIGSHYERRHLMLFPCSAYFISLVVWRIWYCTIFEVYHI